MREKLKTFLTYLGISAFMLVDGNFESYLLNFQGLLHTRRAIAKAEATTLTNVCCWIQCTLGTAHKFGYNKSPI